MAIVDQIAWSDLDRLVEVQQRNRETHSPVISLFRWWARRPHAVARAILDAASAEFGKSSFIVADPFSGGGTVAFEAVRRGHTVYAQDLYPWPSLGLATALTPADAKKLTRASDELLTKLEPYRRLYHWTEGEKTVELTHVIRVRVTEDLAHIWSRGGRRLFTPSRLHTTCSSSGRNRRRFTRSRARSRSI